MEILDKFPIWVVFTSMLIIVLMASELGFRMGIVMKDKGSDTGDSRMTGAVVAGMLGLLGFLMAFSIGIAIGHHGERKSMVVSEANAVGTAWREAGLLNEPGSSTLRKLLHDYAEIRLDAATLVIEFQDAVMRSEELHKDMWDIIERNVREGNDSDIMSGIAQSINDVINTHSQRVTVAGKRLPRVLGIILIGSLILSFLLVGVASSADGKRDTAAIVLFALAIIAVFMLMVDLDRPQQGMLTVGQTAMTDILRQMSPVSQ